MSMVCKRNQHTRPSQHTRPVNTRFNPPSAIKDLARRAGLNARFERVGDSWDWYVTKSGRPVFQGGSLEVVPWLQGYMRGVEESA